MTAATDKKPSPKQIYCLAHLTIDALELDWPANRADASALIVKLKALSASTQTAKGGESDDCPF